MKIYDISVPLSAETPEWPGSTKFEREEIKSGSITAKLIMGSHFGTHIDAPKHFIFDKGSVDKIPLSALVGKFKVFEIKSKKEISLEDLKKLKIAADDKILFKTKNSDFVGSKKKFDKNYISLSSEAAGYLANKKIALVGIDYFGIEAKGQAGHPTHVALLSKKIVIVEGLNLKGIKPGTYQGAILPLKIKDGDGAPARAVLWK